MAINHPDRERSERKSLPFEWKSKMNGMGPTSRNIYCLKRGTFLQQANEIKMIIPFEDFVSKCFADFTLVLESPLHLEHLSGLDY